MQRQIHTLFFIMTAISLSCSPEQDCPQGINLLPMYGRVQKCDAQLQDDDQFIIECDKHFANRAQATRFHIDKGWSYFYQNDLDMAMKRFNQAWLLDSTDADVYWGFGNVLGKQGQFAESVVYFERSANVNPKNSKLWLSAATSYGQLFFQSKDTTFLTKAIGNLKKSVSIDSTNATAYGQLTACYSYFMQQDSARKYLAITDRLDPMAVNPEVRQILTEK